MESRRYLGATRSWALRKSFCILCEQRLEASEAILERWTLDNRHRVSPMLAGIVIKKSCSSIGPILEGHAYYVLRKL